MGDREEKARALMKEEKKAAFEAEILAAIVSGSGTSEELFDDTVASGINGNQMQYDWPDGRSCVITVDAWLPKGFELP